MWLVTNVVQMIFLGKNVQFCCYFIICQADDCLIFFKQYFFNLINARTVYRNILSFYDYETDISMWYLKMLLNFLDF